MKRLIYLSVTLICFLGCSADLESFVYFSENPPDNPGNPPYAIPKIKTADDFTYKVYIDPDYKGGGNNGSITHPYRSINDQYKNGIEQLHGKNSFSRSLLFSSCTPAHKHIAGKFNHLILLSVSGETIILTAKEPSAA